MELSARHLTDRFLPDKAIDVMDEVGAAVRLRPGSKKRKNVGCATSRRSWRAWRGTRSVRATHSDRTRLERLEAICSAVVFGQDAAVETVVRAVKRGRAGLGGTDRPTGSFLFMGPTGVGKTELAKQLAKTACASPSCAST